MRELFSFVLPMMTSDLMPVMKGAVIVLLLGHYYGLRDVALYRVVMPAANMNFLVGTHGRDAVYAFGNADYWREATRKAWFNCTGARQPG